MIGTRFTAATILALSALTLAACGGDSSSSSASGTSSTPTTTTTGSSKTGTSTSTTSTSTGSSGKTTTTTSSGSSGKNTTTSTSGSSGKTTTTSTSSGSGKTGTTTTTKTSGGTASGAGSSGTTKTSTTPTTVKSIKQWVSCSEHIDESLQLDAAINAAAHNAFVLQIDCPVRFHTGVAALASIKVPEGVTIKFVGSGELLTVSNGPPALNVANPQQVTFVDFNLVYL